MRVEIFGRDNRRLVLGAKGFACTEGELVVLRAHADDIASATLCGSPLPARVERDGAGFVTTFECLIDTWAGRSVLRINAGAASETVVLAIAPHDKKLGADAWEDMLQELSTLSKSLVWGMSPGNAEGRYSRDALAAVHPSLLETQLPAFCRLLSWYQREAPTLTVRRRGVRPLELSRRTDIRTLRWLSRRPLEVSALRSPGIEVTTLDGPVADPRVPVDQMIAETTCDHPVTRYVAFLMAQVRRRLGTTAARLRSPAGHGIDDPAVRAYGNELAEEAERAALKIKGFERSAPFRNVRREPMSDGVLQSLPDHPLYLGLHRVGRRLCEPGLAYVPGEDVQSALKRSYDLFELLVLYRMVRGISDSLPVGWEMIVGGDIAHLPHEDRPRDGARWIWQGPEGRKIELIYQMTFPSARPVPDERQFKSLSAQGVPDFVLISRANGNVRSWLILDAKYRSGRKSIHDGLGDIHRYHDALRLAGKPAEAAYIVVPALQDGAQLYGKPEYLEAHALGALVIESEEWLRVVLDWWNTAFSR